METCLLIISCGGSARNLTRLAVIPLDYADGPASLGMPYKLTGTANYRTWRRAMEISLSTKKKLGFIKGTIPKPTDPEKIEQWESCNNIVISWIVHSCVESIGKNVMHMSSAREAWLRLETQFTVNSGSRKYQLLKETYECKQSGMSITDYYTKLKNIWEEIDSMMEIPTITCSSRRIQETYLVIVSQDFATKILRGIGLMHEDT